MNCQDYEQQISAMLDGELPEAECAALQEHLRTCEACAAAYRSFAGLSAVMQDLDAEPPADLSARILEQIEHENVVQMDQARRERRERRSWRGVAAMAACLVLLLGVVHFAGHDRIAQSVPAGIAHSTRAGGGGYVNRSAPEPNVAEVALAADGETEGTDSTDGAALALTMRTALPAEQSKAVQALLADAEESDAPDAEAQPACVALGEAEDGSDAATVWIVGADLVFTRDGEHYFRAANAAEALQSILNN